MKKETIEIELTFSEPVLGSASGDPEIHERFQASKAPTATSATEEVQAVKMAIAPTPQEAEEQLREQIERTSTVFPRDENGIFIWDYQVRGFLKEAIGTLVELGQVKLSKWLYKKAVDSLVFVHPRRIYLLNPSGEKLTAVHNTLQRPLRVDGPRGERVCLARSEAVKAGTKIRFSITLLQGKNEKSKLAVLTLEDIFAALDYGALKGCGQWRSGGYGTFGYVCLNEGARGCTGGEGESKAVA